MMTHRNSNTEILEDHIWRVKELDFGFAKLRIPKIGQ